MSPRYSADVCWTTWTIFMLPDRVLDRRHEVAGRDREEADLRPREERLDRRARLVDPHAAQRRLEVEDDARRRDEEVARDERLADAIVARSLEPQVGGDRAAGARVRAAANVLARAGIVDLGDEGVGADVL